MHTFIKTYIIAALLFVSFASVAQTDATITLSAPTTGNYTATERIVLTTGFQSTSFSGKIIQDAYLNPTLSNSENYVFTRVYQDEVSDFDQVSTNSDVIESVTYFDGLGRPKQQTGIKAAPNKQDIITHITYDQLGRQDKQYLPFSSSGTIGTYKTVNINTDINSYYQNKYSDDFSGMAVGEVNAYSQSIYEPSPLNRVLEQGAPGKAWKANAAVDTDHTIKFDWDTNTANEVVYFKVDFPSSNTEAPSLVKDGYYAANVLYITTTKDENWKATDGNNRTTREYKNKLGQVILKRTYNQGDTHDTYYVYDDFGNLTYVIPPKVSLSTTDGVSSEELSELCYQYRYDYRNRLVRKQIPGKGPESIVYNKLDLPILTQDAVQAPNEDWVFTKYDAFGRVIYTGLYSDDRGRLDMEFDVNTNAQYDQKGAAIVVDNTTLYYTNNAFPNHSQQILTINYYDNYTFDHIVANPGTVYNQTVDTNAKGLATGSKVRVLGTNDWIITITYYDTKGRPIYVHSTNEYLNTVDIIETKLDFVGKVLETKTTHTKGNNTPIVTIDTYGYDHMGRALTQSQQINNQSAEQIVSNTYDEIGQLTDKEVGGGLQNVDYTYNVRGWPTQINDPTNLGNDLFGFKINYNTTDKNLGASNLYNGNISETIWKTANDLVERSYGYQYDALNRITNAKGNVSHYDLSNVTYDKNGNILSLLRDGHINHQATSFGTMDDLTYEYNAGNQLVKVTDTQVSQGFKDGTNTNNDYDYDANGNMTVDRNKGISSIGYNHLNLPTSVATNGGFISYIYDATGIKLSKAVTQNGGTTTTDYAGNYVYLSNTGPGGCAGCPSNASGPDLQFFNHTEGYIEPQDDGSFMYIYQYKDHLGNIRLSYADKDNDGRVDVLRNNADIDDDGDLAMEIREEKNYYPFGLQHQGYNNTITGRKHNYGFGGVEEQKELGLEWLDFDARNYDPALGRWMNLDPLAEEMRRFSPYTYAFNNPIYYIDPDGMMPIGLGGMDETDNFDRNTSGVAPIDQNRGSGKDFDASQSDLFDYKRPNYIAGEAGKSTNESGDNNNDCCGGNGSGVSFVMGTDGVDVIGGNENQEGASGLTGLTPIGVGAILSGTKFTFLKPVGALGSSRGSTLLSYSLGKTFNGNIFKTFGNNRITNKLVAKTGTAVVGRVGGRILSRFVPIVGWGLLTYDVGNLFYSNREVLTRNQQSNIQSIRENGIKTTNRRGQTTTIKPMFPGSCFVAGTKVLMLDGSEKNIEDIKVGDEIMSVDIDNMKVEGDLVVKLPDYLKKYKKIVAEFSNGQTNKFSPAHPYWVKGKGWSVFDIEEAKSELTFRVEKMEVGDTVMYYEDGKLKETEILELYDTSEMIEMYNVEFVQKNHTFFANGILVHNKLGQ